MSPPCLRRPESWPAASQAPLEGSGCAWLQGAFGGPRTALEPGGGAVDWEAPHPESPSQGLQTVETLQCLGDQVVGQTAFLVWVLQVMGGNPGVWGWGPASRSPEANAVWNSWPDLGGGG